MSLPRARSSGASRVTMRRQLRLVRRGGIKSKKSRATRSVSALALAKQQVDAAVANFKKRLDWAQKHQYDIVEQLVAERIRPEVDSLKRYHQRAEQLLRTRCVDSIVCVFFCAALLCTVVAHAGVDACCW